LFLFALALALLLLDLVFWCYLEILLVPLVDVFLLITDGAILVVCLGVDRVQVGDREGNFDTAIRQKRRKIRATIIAYVSSPNCLVRTTSSWPGVSITSKGPFSR
jgi:hypothetical protein